VQLIARTSITPLLCAVEIIRWRYEAGGLKVFGHGGLLMALGGDWLVFIVRLSE
jgi:hypothetical protein